MSPDKLRGIGMRTFIIVAILCAASSADGQHYDFVRKIENPHASTDGQIDNFGYWIGTVEDKLIVGAYDEDTGAKDAGAVYLFDSDGQLLTTIHNPDPVASGAFGWNVTSLGDRLLVGAWQNAGGGSAYLFEQDGSLIQKIENPTGKAGDHFGNSFAPLPNGGFAITAPHSHDGLGAAYIYDQSGVLQDTLLNESSGTTTLGRIAVTDSDRLLIALNKGNGVGAVNLYYSKGSYLQTIPNPTAAVSGFGYGAAFVGDNIVVGAHWDESKTVGGSVFVFDAAGSLVREISNPEPGPADSFGYYIVPASSTTFLVSAVFDPSSVANTETGSVYLYDVSGNLLQTIPKPDPVLNESDHFGVDMVTSGDFLYIGSHMDGGRRSNVGSVYVYKLVPEPSAFVLGLLALSFVAIRARCVAPVCEYRVDRG